MISVQVRVYFYQPQINLSNFLRIQMEYHEIWLAKTSVHKIPHNADKAGFYYVINIT